jgi:hypothetical protein
MLPRAPNNLPTSQLAVANGAFGHESYCEEHRIPFSSVCVRRSLANWRRYGTFEAIRMRTQKSVCKMHTARMRFVYA